MAIAASELLSGIGDIFLDPSETLAISAQRLLLFEEIDQLIAHSGIAYRWVHQLSQQILAECVLEAPDIDDKYARKLLNCVHHHISQSRGYGWSILTYDNEGNPISLSPSDITYNYDESTRLPTRITSRYGTNIDRNQDEFHLTRSIKPTRRNWLTIRRSHVYGAQIGISQLNQSWKSILRWEIYQNILQLTLSRFNQDVLSVPDLVQLAQSSEFDRYIENLTITRSLMGVILTDQELGSYSILERHVDWVADAVNTLQRIVSTEIGWPESYLFCQSPSGNTSGRMDTNHWDMLKSEVFFEYANAVKWFCDLNSTECKISLPRSYTLDEIGDLVAKGVLSADQALSYVEHKINPLER